MAEIELEHFLEVLSELSLKEIKVPEHLRIPDWPRMAGKITVALGKPEYYSVAKSEETGLLRIVHHSKRKEEVYFTIEEGGTFYVSFTGSNSAHSASSTTNRAELERIRALLIFHQFKEEIYTKVIEKLHADLPAHERAARFVEEALAPFRASPGNFGKP